MRYFKFFFFFSYKVFKILKTVNLYQDQLATLQVLWSHTWPVATGLDSTGIERAYDEEILYPMRLHFILFPRGNLCFNGLFILLSPPYFFFIHVYIYLCLFVLSVFRQCSSPNPLVQRCVLPGPSNDSWTELF